MLITLAYRVPREHLAELLGTVTAYPLTARFQDAWATLPQPPRYGVLATGLVAATGKPVQLFRERDLADRERESGGKALLLTTDSALDHRLRIAVREWERHSRGSGPLLLPDCLPEPEPARQFAGFIEFRPGEVPRAPNSVFRVAAWQIAKALAYHPLVIDGRAPVRLRMDTSGRLVSWEDDDLIATSSGRAFAMTNVTVNLTTRPGVQDLVLTFDGHLSRLDRRGTWYRRIWIDRKPETPVLDLPVRIRKVEGEWQRYLDPAIASILKACQVESLSLPEKFPDRPATHRPRLSSGGTQSLGSGPGPRFMLRLHEYITEYLPQLVPLTYELDKEINLPERIKKFPKHGVLPESIAPTGYKKMTIACLYRTAEARDRMLEQLLELTKCRPAADGSLTPVHERLNLVARHCPRLLEHGTPNRAMFLDHLDLPREEDHLVVAWVETEFHPDMERPEFDAKPHLRRLFGHLGIPTQFLATEPVVLPEGATRASPETQRHAARSALRDLLRSAGVLDERMRDAVTKDRLRNKLDRRTLLLGINARAQNAANGERPFVLTMTAVLADPADLEQWRVLMYSESKARWVRAAEGLTDFHAGAIGVTHLGRAEGKAETTRVEVEHRLAELVSADLRNVPVAVFVDAQAARAIWSGLQNVRFGTGPLPGDSLRAQGLDVAVIRMHADMADLGRPVTRVDEGNKAVDRLQPAAPGKGVYRLVESSVPSWLFAGKSASLEAKHGRTGALFTRWTLPAELSKELRTPWHSYTAREIVIARSGLWDPVELAALAARLCEQPIAWDGRTITPGPVHLGIAVDKDHPEYRMTEAGDE
ncbi:RNaseH domain-containing protein [Crossiella sp. NPDC003009]